MRAKNSTSKQEGGGGGARTFTEQGRRAQIIAAAIEVIAEVGYHKASFAKIAKQAGLSSTGMISYHFDGREDLMREVAGEVTRIAEGDVRPRVEAHEHPSDRLRAAIEGEVDLFARYPSHRAALVEVLGNLGGDDPGMAAFIDDREAVLALQVEQLRKAQRAGAFRDFDPWVMVRAMRAALNDIGVRATRDPGLDVRAAGRELADLFDHATRNTP